MTEASPGPLRDASGRFTDQPDVIRLITQAYEQRQEEAAAAPLTAEEIALVDRVAEQVIADDAREAAQKAHGEFLAGILYPSEAQEDSG